MSTSTMPAVIMVVDDVPANVKLLGEILRAHGYQVQAFTDGAQALTAAAASPPDLILLDIMMPRMNGLEVLKQVRQIAPRVKIVMITAFGDVGSYLDSMELGACEYVNKPFETAELLQMIHKVTAGC